MAFIAVGAFLSAGATGQTVTRNSVAAKHRPSTPTATTASDAPDFAFPDKVAADADKQLKTALDSGDGAEVVNALVCYSIARDCVSPELLKPALARIDSVTRVEPDSRVKSLLNLLRATIYNDLYKENRWNYDHRQIPLDSMPADYTEWSGAQFKLHINALLDSALIPRAELLASPIGDWNKIITTNEYTAIFYPTLYDMVVNSAISIKKQLRTVYSPILPARYVMPHLAMEPLPAYAAVSPENRDIHTLYLDWIAAHPDRLPPRLNAILNDIDFMSDLTNYNSDLDAAYIAVYKQYQDYDWSVEALGRCSNSDDLAPLLSEAITRFPNYFRINLLKSKLFDIEAPSLELFTDSYAAPGHNIKVTAEYRNLYKFKINIARLPLSVKNVREHPRLTKELAANPLKTVSIANDYRPRPFYNDTTIEIPLTEPGIYYAWCTYDSIKNQNDLRAVSVICSDITPVSISHNGKIYPYALNSFDGQPLKGVSISQYNYRDMTPRLCGVTNNDGTISGATLDRPSMLLYTLGNQSLVHSPVYTTEYGKDQSRSSLKLFTSLPLYHHGDSVQWCVMAYSSNKDGDYHLDSNKMIVVKILDPNNNPISSSNVTTDSSGRATGSIKLPDEGLSGNYRITAEYYNRKENKSFTYESFKVNDYKLPTFTVAVTSVSKNSINPDSTVTINCQAKTYSGFPVADARISVELADAELFSWYYSRSSNPFWTTDTVTDSNGTISITIPQAIFDLSPSESDGFNISFDITSPSGETHSCSQIINLGKPYDIKLQSYGPYNIDKNLSDIKVNVYDAMGNTTDICLDYCLINKNDTIPVDLTSPIPHIKPGRYKLRVAPRDTTLADIAIFNNITLYRSTGPSIAGKRLFVPVNSFTTDNATVDVPIGTEDKDTPILVNIAVDYVMDSQYWMSSKGGMENLQITIPDDAHEVRVLLTTVYNCNQSTANITIERPTHKLDVKIESFRDKVTPLANEQITFSTTIDSHPTEASLIMAMQSKALLSLAPSSFNIYVQGIYYPELRASELTNSSQSCYYARFYNGKIPQFKYPSVTIPSLNLYYHTYGSQQFSTFSSRKYLRGLAANSNANVVYDAVEQAPVFAQEEVVSVTNFSDGTNDLTIARGIDVNDSDAGESAADTFNYRPSEIPLAFFAPMLSTDAEGRLTYTYTVPDANTAWTLKGIAYTPDLKTATFEREIIASRPVMVQPTLPRFMRYGDTATVTASVMNATDSAQCITTVVTLLDADNHPLSTHSFTDTVAANSSVTVSTPVTAPLTGTALIYRVKATAGNYTDGEQTILPLLPASQPVITSTPFYMQPDSTHMQLDIPAAGAENSTTLYMYDNPLWEVISALPSLSDGDAITSPGAASQLYMAAIARGIMQRNPAIRQGLKAWLDSDRSDSTLTSMLNRNDELKQLSISATPWVREAMSDTERLTSLALLLDDSNTTAVINRSIKTLGNLATSSGGFEWCPSNGNASLWATYRVLELLASLKERGYMPADKKLGDMLTKAIAYIDQSIANDLARNKNRGDYTRYSYIRSRLGATQASPAASKAITLTVNNILKRWESEPVADKGIDAVILYHNGYPTMARRVIASIKAYSITKPDNGTHWHGLDADAAARLLFAIETITPDDKALINSVAQWLIVNKTNTSWGNSAATSATIDALLGAINAESAVNATATVTLNGQPVSNTTPQMPGMTVADISADVAGAPATLSVDKSGSMPLMGSIISRRVAVMDSIPAASCPSVSIAKRYNKVDGTTVTDAADLTPGDRVNIQLVIKVTEQLDYVTVIDRRAACLEPVEQLSRYTSTDGLWYYREVTDSETRYFIGSLRPGTYVIDTAMNVVVPGLFSSGVATLQSQLNPGVTANSSTRPIIVK